jgi:hypothetical protein
MSSTNMGRLLGHVVTAALVCGVAGTTVGVDVARAATPGYSALPTGALSLAPGLGDKPEHIAPTEKVVGVYPALPPERYNKHSPHGSRYISVFTNEQQAKRFSADGGVRPAPDSLKQPQVASACVSVADHWHMKQGPQEWPLSFSAHASIHGVDRGSEAAKQYPNVGVRALHLEQLTFGDGGKASLQMTDSWVDPTTMGVRLIGKSALPLEQVAQGPGGVRVFAARDSRNGGVHFVVHSPPGSERARNVVGRHMTVARGSRMSSSDCGHARLSLRTALGTGERGTVSIELVLSIDEDDAKKNEAKSSVFKRSAFKALLGGKGAQPAIKEVRVRTLLVHTSVSQTAGDAAPIPSVTFGWQGRERRMQTR